MRTRGYFLEDRLAAATPVTPANGSGAVVSFRNAMLSTTDHDADQGVLLRHTFCAMKIERNCTHRANTQGSSGIGVTAVLRSQPHVLVLGSNRSNRLAK
jgi:hypothetical protein